MLTKVNVAQDPPTLPHSTPSHPPKKKKEKKYLKRIFFKGEKMYNCYTTQHSPWQGPEPHQSKYIVNTSFWDRETEREEEGYKENKYTQQLNLPDSQRWTFTATNEINVVTLTVRLGAAERLWMVQPYPTVRLKLWQVHRHLFDPGRKNSVPVACTHHSTAGLPRATGTLVVCAEPWCTALKVKIKLPSEFFFSLLSTTQMESDPPPGSLYEGCRRVLQVVQAGGSEMSDHRVKPSPWWKETHVYYDGKKHTCITINYVHTAGTGLG